MNRKIKVLVRLFWGPVVWLRNILLEIVYSTNRKFEFAGCELLGSNGYAIFPNKLDEVELSALKKDFLEIQRKKTFETSGQLAGRLYAHGAISALSTDYIEKFQPIAEAYFGSKKIRCELTMYQKSWPKTDINDIPGGEFHEDDNKRNMKFFIYLTDVSNDNGPFSYVPKTHGLRRPEKYIRWLFWEIFHSRKYLYHYQLDQRICELEEVKITGQAGTIFCADTTGYHRASTPLAGERDVFVVSYTRG